LGALGGEVCVYCVKSPATRREHVIPRAWYTGDLPEGIRTVPGCEECDGRKALEENTFIEEFGARLEWHELPSVRDPNERFLRNLDRPEARRLKERILFDKQGTCRFELAEVRSAAGLVLGNAPIWHPGEEVFRRQQSVVTRQVRGLYYVLYEDRLAATAKITTVDLNSIKDKSFLGEDPFTMFREGGWNAQDNRDGSYVFRFKPIHVPEKPYQAMWLLEYFGVKYFISFIVLGTKQEEKHPIESI